MIFSYWALDKDHNSLLLNSANMVMRRSSHLLAILLKLAAILSNGEVMCSLVPTEQETINKCVFGCAVNALPRPGLKLSYCNVQCYRVGVSFCCCIGYFGGTVSSVGLFLN